MEVGEYLTCDILFVDISFDEVDQVFQQTKTPAIFKTKLICRRWGWLTASELGSRVVFLGSFRPCPSHSTGTTRLPPQLYPTVTSVR